MTTRRCVLLAFVIASLASRLVAKLLKKLVQVGTRQEVAMKQQRCRTQHSRASVEEQHIE
jgi:hypothetical protein